MMSMSSISELIHVLATSISSFDSDATLGREQEGCRDIFNTLHGNMEVSTGTMSSLRGSLLLLVAPCVECALCALDRPSCSRPSKIGCRNSRATRRKQQGHGMRLEIMIAIWGFPKMWVEKNHNAEDKDHHRYPKNIQK